MCSCVKDCNRCKNLIADIDKATGSWDFVCKAFGRKVSIFELSQDKHLEHGVSVYKPVEHIEPSDSDMDKINAYSRMLLNPEDIYVIDAVIGDNLIDESYERFSKECLEAMTALIVGKPGAVDGRNPPIVFESYIETLDWYVTDDEPAVRLHAKIFILRDKDNLSLIDSIESDPSKEISTGLAVKFRRCSICKYTTCHHQPGESYDGYLCHFVLDSPHEVYEWAFVERCS